MLHFHYIFSLVLNAQVTCGPLGPIVTITFKHKYKDQHDKTKHRIQKYNIVNTRILVCYLNNVYSIHANIDQCRLNICIHLTPSASGSLSFKGRFHRRVYIQTMGLKCPSKCMGTGAFFLGCYCKCLTSP